MTGRLIRSWSVASSVAFAIACGAHSAHADAHDVATAASLFEEGKRLMRDGHDGEACPKLAESQRLDPGLGTMLWLADCYEKTGRTASAWALFDSAALIAKNKGDSREKVARARAEKLNAKLVKLSIEVAPDSRIDGLEVLRDDKVITPVMWGAAVALDPGKHTITAHGPGGRKFETTVMLESAPVTTVTVVLGPPNETAPAPLVAGESTPGEPHQAFLTPDRLRVGTYVALGVAVVGVGLGTYFGLSAKSHNDDSKSHCVNDICDATGVSERSSAVSAATASTITFVVGGVALAASGVGFYLQHRAKTTPVSARVIPVATPNGGGLTVVGSF